MIEPALPAVVSSSVRGSRPARRPHQRAASGGAPVAMAAEVASGKAQRRLGRPTATAASSWRWSSWSRRRAAQARRGGLAARRRAAASPRAGGPGRRPRPCRARRPGRARADRHRHMADEHALAETPDPAPGRRRARCRACAGTPPTSAAGRRPRRGRRGARARPPPARRPPAPARASDAVALVAEVARDEAVRPGDQLRPRRPGGTQIGRAACRRRRAAPRRVPRHARSCRCARASSLGSTRVGPLPLLVGDTRRGGVSQSSPSCTTPAVRGQHLPAGSGSGTSSTGRAGEHGEDVGAAEPRSGRASRRCRVRPRSMSPMSRTGAPLWAQAGGVELLVKQAGVGIGRRVEHGDAAERARRRASTASRAGRRPAPPRRGR